VKFLVRSIFLFLCLAGIALAAFYAWLTHPLAFPAGAARVEFRVPAGVGLRGAIKNLAAAGVEVEPRLLVLASRLQSWHSRNRMFVRAGTYGLAAGTTPLQLLDTLHAGKVLQTDVRLIEGWTFRQWRQRLKNEPYLTHELADLDDATLMKRLGFPQGIAPEGQFFPETYRLDRYASDRELLALAAKTMRETLAREWAARQEGLPYRTPYEALIMASIVEKETGQDADRPRVASVFVNRLRLGMRLQTDPSVIYGLGDAFDGNLRRRDLEADTPWNTYTRAGLPPTPIAMPGLASLRAALHPEASRYLYFVARGDGSSEFSETLEAHNRAVNRYQRRRG
jgi:UPF0755 protein